MDKEKLRGSNRKKQYPDEVVDGIIARAQELAEQLPASMFAGLTEQQIRDYWEQAQYLMLLGADVALDYMDKKSMKLLQKLNND